MTVYAFEPLDTLFFRDAQPFNSGEGGNNIVASLFPPNPPTLVGALRATLARTRGWPGGDWRPEIKAVLGDRSSLGMLGIRGPYLLRDGKPLFPAPANLFGKPHDHAWTNVTLLKPGPSVDCDLGASVRLPIPATPAEDLEFLSEAWLDGNAMSAVLAARAPDNGMVHSSALWSDEPRTGIARTFETHAVETGALYTSRHVRMRPNVTLAIGVDGLPNGWMPGSLALTGGESRMSWVRKLNAGIALPSSPALTASQGALCYTVILATPALLPSDALKPGNALANLPGRIVSACADHPLKLGGWHELDRESKGPLALRALLPPGTTWFMEARDGDVAQAAKMHGQHIGERPEWGFGQILIGMWKE